MNVRDFLEEKVRACPDKVFLRFEDMEQTYREFNDLVNRAASGLVGLGVAKGDKVCLMLPNIPEFLHSWFAACKIGAVMVPVNTGFKSEETKYILRHSQAVGCITSSEHSKTIGEIRADCPDLKWVMSVDDVCSADVLSYKQTMTVGYAALSRTDLSEDDLAVIIYTSGTTGFPKGVMHVHRSLPLVGEAFTVTTGITPDDRLMVILPLHHLNAEFYSVLGALAGWASLVLIRQFSASKFWEQAHRYGVTQFNFVGAAGKILCARPRSEYLPGHSIRVAYGAAVSPEVYDTFQKEFEIPYVIDGYGMTEAPRVCQNPLDRPKKGSMGIPARHPDPTLQFSKMKVVLDDGATASAGQAGELLVRSPVLMKGYYRDPEQTEKAFQDGWLKTGDRAYQDGEGYFFFVDRKKNIVRRRGENISPREIELAVEQHPAVAEVAVIGIPSKLTEEDLLACIVPKPGFQPSPEEIIDWCKDRLATFKVPRYILFRSELPKTATLRVVKHKLLEEPGIIESAYDSESSRSHP